MREHTDNNLARRSLVELEKVDHCGRVEEPLQGAVRVVQRGPHVVARAQKAHALAGLLEALPLLRTRLVELTPRGLRFQTSRHDRFTGWMLSFYEPLALEK